MEVVGKVGGKDLIINKGKKELISLPVSKLNDVYYNSIRNSVEVR